MAPLAEPLRGYRRFVWRCLLIVCGLLLVGTHLYFSWKVFSLTQQTKAFEKKHVLAALGADQLVISEVPLDSMGQWHLYAEAPREYRLRICGKIDDIDNWPTKTSRNIDVYRYHWPLGQDPIEELGFTIKFRFRDEKGKAALECKANFVTGSIDIPDDHPLRSRPLSQWIAEVLPATPTEATDHGVPRLLLRIRVPDEPQRGLVVWIENRRPDPQTGL